MNRETYYRSNLSPYRTKKPSSFIAYLFICLLFSQTVLVKAQSDEDNQADNTDTMSGIPIGDPNPKVNELAGTWKGEVKTRIDGIEPEAGPTTGETRVLVRGGPFAELQLYFPSPKCKFGHDDMVVDATYVLCTSAPVTIKEREARHRDKNDTCLQCDNAPASAKPEIIPFTVSLKGDFSDSVNSVPYRYYPPTRVYAIYPRYGPKDGETVVQVWGENFLNFDQNTRCGFGSKSVPATFINSNYMICVAPFSDVVEKPIPFSISLNNQQNSKDSVMYWYYSWPAISELVPDRGPDTGGTRVLLKGRNFFPFKDYGNEIDNRNDTFCMFENLAKVPATIINSTKAVCYSPPSYVLRQSIVEITLNNQQYTDDNNIFYYYRPPYLFDINPREGPVSGGTRVIAIGSNFRDTGNITCKFNDTLIVPGKFLTTSEIECYSPPVDHPGYVPLSVSLEMDMYSPSVQYLYYEKPEILDIYPKCGPDYGYTQITVLGKNFIDMGHNKALCVFNKTIFTNATIMNENTIKCDSPTLYNDQGFSTMTSDYVFYEVEVTIDGGRNIEGPKQNFTYYKDPTLSDIVPGVGPIRGNTTVAIKGKGFNHPGACNKTVRFATFETKPINQTEDKSIWVKSPAVKIPDQVVVAVALNGQQFTKDIVIHQRDNENTFEYYDEPFVTSYTPHAGPSIGGTKIKINGFGFTPKKDKNGDVDKDKNKMYIRFVDPDTLEPLAPTTEVDEETLFDDEAQWKTPALPSDTKALMQISLNNQDWTNVPQPNKTYSFYYYESPHIDKLYPSFGPVKEKGEKFMDIQGRNFKCPDANCSELRVRFGEPDQGILVRAQWLNESFVRCKIPKYTKPDVLRVELTLNGQDYTDDKKTYGYFDPYVLDAEPRLISVDGTTVVKVKGFGFVNSGETKSLENSPANANGGLTCQGQKCTKDAKFIDKNTLETNTFPQKDVNYASNGENIMFDPIALEASVYENDFTENNVEIYYYQEPDYKNISTDESPANQENDIIVTTDFKENPQSRLDKYGNFTCRFKGDDGTVKYTKAEMIKYPLEKGYKGKSNAIKCKNPTWDLKDKTQEKVKLDFSINGQEFKGGFDFFFTYQLIIHRTVPMAGPVKGNTTTRIIGTGFKPLHRKNVDLKWGVLRTEIIKKEVVTDYIYSQVGFENMIEGSEELKAYIYEASNFKRVDEEMFEEHTYHSFYTQTSKMWYDNKTHGGPYYVEVGNNIQIDYQVLENVTFDTGQIINNATNETLKITSEQNVTKHWTYYDYEPSKVEFYYYKDCIVKQIQPHAGLLQGGTEVQVVGAWFKYYPQYGVVPHCKFGDKIVRGHFDSTVRIVCRAPPNSDIGVILPFEVSLNGVDWIKTQLEFSYYLQPNLTDISPDAGPAAGGTPIYIHGSNFTNMSNPNEFNCRFTPLSLNIPPKYMPGIYVNETTIMCASPGGWGQGDAMKLQVTFNGGDYDNNNFTFTFFSVSRAFPRSGPSDGNGGDIIVQGIGFRNDTNPICKINNTEYPPNSVAWNEIRCPMPKALSGDDYFGNVPFSVSANGRDWHNFVGGFQYYPQPIVEDIFPKQGPAVGVGIINFYGDGFRDDYSLIDMGCKIGESVGKAVFVTSKHIKCVVEDIELVNEGEYLPAQVALNSYSWTQLTNDTFFLPYGIESIYPNSGPTTGVTDVIISGKGFQDDQGATARCRFGTPANFAIVEAQILSYERMVCRAPSGYSVEAPAQFPQDVPFSIAIGNDEYDPWTETSHKFRFYDQPVIVSADPPEVEVGTIQEVLVFADGQTEFFQPTPAIKITDQFSDDSLFGQQYTGITCQFGRFGETQAIYINETVIKCVTPAVEDDPDSIYREEVRLTVAMNGNDHDEESSQVDFTFVGTGTYLVFWPFIIGALLIGLLIVALVACCSTLFQYFSLNDYLAGRSVGGDPRPHVIGMGSGVTVPRGRVDWNKPNSSVDIVERAAGPQIY